MKTLLAALLLTFSVHAADFAKVDAEIERVMKDASVPGAAVVVVQDGHVVHQRAFGVTSIETRVPVATSTLFRLGSTAKLFTALAVLKLADDKRLRLDQPIGELVPDLAPPLRRLTLDQLLSHTAGLADDAPMNGPLEEGALHARFTSWPAEGVLAAPGEIFSYANPGYALAADVVAHIDGKPFSEAVDELVLVPMGMKEATYRPLVAMTRSLALGHDGNGVIRPFAENAANYAPGSLFVSAEDLGRFFCALSPALLERLGTPHAAIPAQGRSYGYGLIIDERYGPRLLLHPGGRSGYGSTFMFLPAQHVAVAVLANRTSATLSSAAFEAIAEYATLGALPKTQQTTADAASLRGIDGTYGNGRMLPAVQLVVTGDQLEVRLGGKSLHATPAGPDRFHIEGGGQLETFLIVRDQQGAPRFLCAETWALAKRS